MFNNHDGCGLVFFLNCSISIHFTYLVIHVLVAKFVNSNFLR